MRSPDCEDVTPIAPCERAFYRRIPEMLRRVPGGRSAGGGGGGSVIGGGPGAPDLSLYGLTNFSALNYFASAAGGGESGVAGGPWGYAILARLSFVSGVLRSIFSRRMTSSPFNGYNLVYTAANQAQNQFGSNGTFGANSSPFSFVASDAGKLQLLSLVFDATQTRFYVGRDEIGAVPFTGNFDPATVMATVLGARQDGLPFDNGMILSAATWRGAVTAAQVAAFADATRARGDLPETIAGQSVTHRWSAKDELFRVTNPAGRKTYGARNWSTADHYATAQGATTGIVGAAGGFFVQARHKIESVFGAGNRFFALRGNSSTQGYNLEQTGLTFRVRISNGTAMVASPAYTFSASDIGRTVLMTGVLDTPNNLVRFYVDGVEVGAGTSWASATYGVPNDPTGATAQMFLGRWHGGAPTDGNSTIFQVAGGHVVPTAPVLLAQAQASEQAGTLVPIAGTLHHYDLDADIKASGSLTALPATITDRVGSNPLAKAGTALELAIDTATAPPAPAQLTDTATRVTADALLRIGAPQVRIIDPTVDGRRTLGSQGHSVANYLTCAGGVAGSGAGFWFVLHAQPNAVPGGGNGRLCAKGNGAVTQGYRMFATPTLGWGACSSGGSEVVSPTTTVVAADVGRPALYLGQHDGTKVRFWLNGVQVGDGVAITGYLGTSSPFVLGRDAGGINDASAFSVFGSAGGNYVLTQAEITQIQADFERTGRIVPPVGKTDHAWDLTTDTLASGVDAVPAQVLDRVGTDHLSKVGVAVQTDANAIRSVGPYSVADGWTTGPGGGIRGAAGGVNVELDVWLTKVPTATEMLAECTDSLARSGWFFQAASASLRFWCVTGITGVQSGTYTLAAGDLNKRLRLTGNLTAAGAIQFFVNGVQVGSDVALGGAYTVPAATVAMAIGQHYAAQNFSSGYVEAIQGGNAPIAAGDVTTLNASLTTAPPSLGGTLTTKRYIFETDIAAVSGALPAKSVERISGGDDMARAGSPLVLAQRTERLWSYETSPVMLGGTTFTDADYYGSNTLGFQGSTAGYWVSLLLYILPGSSSATRILISDVWGTGGWYMTTSGANATLQFTSRNTSDVNGAVIPLLSSDVGKLLLVTMQYDPSIGKLRSFSKRLEASQVTCAGYVVPTGGMYIGRSTTGAGFGAGNVALLGVSAGNALISLAEYQAQYDACMARERMIEVPGKADFLVDFTLEGALPATLTDRKGSAHLPKVGAPTLHQQYARAWGI